MASSYPSSIDAFPDPLANSPLDAPSHSGLHQDVNDAVEKIETKVGLGSSPASSASAGQVLKSSGSGNTGWSDIVVGDIDATGRAVNDVIVADGAGNAAWSAAAGLWLVGSTTFTTSTNPFINGCFSSTYQNYIVKVFVIASTPVNLFVRMRSGVDTPEVGGVYDGFGFRFDVGITSLISANQTRQYLCDVTNAGGNRSAISMDIFGANQTVPTIINTHTWDSNTGAVYFPSSRIETNTAYTGIELVPSSGNLTGTMRVYGYRN